MKIGVAQIKPVKGNIIANVDKHLQLIELACLLKANAIFFPELSLTGYEPKLAKDLSIHEDDDRLDVFQQISNKNKITIGLGVPAKTKKGIQISMVIFRTGESRMVYAKQQLHADELPYFIKGNKQIILTVDNKKIAPAICYESLLTEHAGDASKLGADIYMASVAKAQSGVNKAMMHYPVIAKKYAMPVLMSNCIGYCDNFLSVGLSAAWSDKGVLLEQLDDKNEGILIFDTETQEAVKKAI